MALAALEMKVRDPKRVINDNGHFQLGNHVFRDSTRGRGYGPVDMHRSIVVSSDVYYYSLAQEMGIDRIHDFMKPFGFGQITGIDLVGEARGILPSREWKQRRFKQRWAQGDTISIGIGQGYNAFTILQLAHAVATLANDGIVMKPHLVKKIINSKTGEEEIVAKNPVDVIPLKKENVNFIKRAMQDVTQKGTGRAILRVLLIRSEAKRVRHRCSVSSRAKPTIKTKLRSVTATTPYLLLLHRSISPRLRWRSWLKTAVSVRQQRHRWRGKFWITT